MAVDSGASATVISDDMLKSVQMSKGRSGVMCEIADGTRMPNFGEQFFRAFTDNGLVKKMRVDVAEVNEALLSVRKLMQAGSTVIFDPKGSFFRDVSGAHIPLKEKKGIYMISLWVRTGDTPLAPF